MQIVRSDRAVPVAAASDDGAGAVNMLDMAGASFSRALCRIKETDAIDVDGRSIAITDRGRLAALAGRAAMAEAGHA